MPEPQTVAADHHGTAGPVVTLLHGQGAAGVVWDGVVATLAASHRLVVPDLPGHGRSGRLPRYTAGSYAAAVADVLPTDEPVVLVGHSLGGMVAMMLATGHFGVRASRVLCLDVKARWTPEQAARRAERAARPPRRYDDAAQARTAFARAAGLSPDTPAEALDVGVAPLADGGWGLAHDPATAALPPVPPEDLARLHDSVPCPVRLACGGADPMVTPEDMALIGREVRVLPDAGHNPHIDQPEVVADLIAREW